MKYVLHRDVLIKFFLSVSVLFFLSFLRVALIVILPFYVLAFFSLFKLPYSRRVLAIILFFILLSTLVSSLYLKEFSNGNFILSVYILVPAAIFYFSRSSMEDDSPHGSYFGYFMKMSTFFLLVSNCIGFIQIILNPNTDDAFIGLYGANGLGAHTLCIVNFLLCSFYYFKYRTAKTWNNILLGLFFFISGIVCFYGLGLIIFAASVVIYNISLRSFVKSLLISFFVLLFFAVGLYLIKPQTFYYNYNNIKIVKTYFDEDIDPAFAYKIPRKMLLYKNYYSIYMNDPILFLFGSGPGTFNSRSSFLLNGEYSKSKLFEKILGVYHPKYASVGVYPLWNSKNSNSNLTNGTRNEPFSSIISLLSEYGFIVFAVLLISVYSKMNTLYREFNRYLKNCVDPLDKERANLLFNYIRLSSIFIFLGLFTENYLEYPEIILFFIIGIKLVELRLNTLLNVSRKG